MRTETIRTWAWAHKWSSLVCTAFLLMLCITGLPLIFHEEIEAITDPPPPLAHVAAGTPDVSLDRVLARAMASRPGEVPLYMSFDDERPVVYVTTARSPDADGTAMHFQSFDQRTGAAIPTPPPGGLMDLLLRIHVDMLVGLPGMLFLGAMGLLFAVAIVSGVVLYVPFTAHMPFGKVRYGRRPRVRWTDLHNLFGVTTLLWALVVGLTGTINTLATPMMALWRADELAAMTAPYKGQPVPRTLSSIQAAMDKATAAAPGMRPQFVAFPGVPYSSSHHFAIFLQGRTPLTQKLLTPALVDARSGRLDAIRPMPWYVQALLLSQPLHFGDYGGMAMKLLWAVLDVVTIVVLGSGLYLWIGRPRRRPA